MKNLTHHMFGKAIWDKLPYCIFENHEGDLSQKSPKPWLLVNHTKLTNSCIEVIIFSQGGNYKSANGQLQNSGQL